MIEYTIDEIYDMYKSVLFVWYNKMKALMFSYYVDKYNCLCDRLYVLEHLGLYHESAEVQRQINKLFDYKVVRQFAKCHQEFFEIRDLACEVKEWKLDKQLKPTKLEMDYFIDSLLDIIRRD